MGKKKNKSDTKDKNVVINSIPKRDRRTLVFPVIPELAEEYKKKMEQYGEEIFD